MVTSAKEHHVHSYQGWGSVNILNEQALSKQESSYKYSTLQTFLWSSLWLHIAGYMVANVEHHIEEYSEFS